MNKLILRRFLAAVIALSAAFAVTAIVKTTARADDFIEINEKNFPDEIFRAYVTEQFDDAPTDGKLSVSEREAALWISLSEKAVTSVKGIEFFPNIYQFYSYKNNLGDVDLSKNTKLTDVRCPLSGITSLDLSGCKQVELLKCAQNKITKLDLSGMRDLTTLECEMNEIAEIDLTGCTSLDRFHAYDNKITELDISTNTELDYVMLEENRLKALDIQNNKKIKRLFLFDNPIEVFDVSPNAGLLEAYKIGERREQVHGSGADSHRYVSYSSANGYFDIDLQTEISTGVEISGENFPDRLFRSYIEDIYDRDNNGILSLTEIKSVKSMRIGYLSFQSLKGIEFFTELELLECNNNRLQSLDVSKNTKLKKLYCGNNVLTELDISQNKELQVLDCSFARLRKLDTSANDKLWKLYISHNYLEELDLSKNTELKEFKCEGNFLKTIDVKNNTKLAHFDCGRNEIATLDLSNNKDLVFLYCNDNKLKAVNVKNNPLLQYFGCQNNEIVFLDTRNNPDLLLLNCSNNDLDDLDVSENFKLETLRCKDNNIDEIYVSDIPKELVKDRTAKLVFVSPSDWRFSDISWFGYDGELSAGANYYSYTNSGEKKYAYAAMTITKKVVDATCVKSGEKTYTATVDASTAYDGKARESTKKVTIPATGHSWGDWIVTKEATAEKEGSRKHTCSVCGKTETEVIPKPDVTLTLEKDSLSIICGQNKTLKATVKGVETAPAFKSSDSKIASVDSNGKITAKMAGTVTITVSVAGIKSKCTVTVLYKDVTDSSKFWFEPVNYLTAKGVVKGYDSQTNFKPDNKCTRAQMITFLWRLQGEPAPKSDVCRFPDVRKTDYFYKACIWGSEQGIVEGYSNGNFGPQITCARKHAVTFMWRLAGKPAPSGTNNRFTDVNETDYFYKATLWASEKRILEGYSDNTFRPDGDCLRRQMVTFLYKYDKFVNGNG
ncbi:MAG: S-layer homology domain-containing protein [Saccharofermentans sp.]|nr:S-layer homology domain-containing protein [Saccharofermentans sp.]